MNKIVRDYPVDQLPADLREGLPEHGQVEIEFRLKDQPEPRVLLAPLVGSVPNIHGSDEEVIRYIRELRDDR
ncbi:MULTISPECIES: hypothetical protein [Rhodopseudomonas]|uniref:hypothetical protein n=1 Tax=Rhodopseudomonas TaxID=1073 RepID=UPI000AF04885|nr:MULTISPECIES: hypothetical protein [Rhodopseudomonas]MDF3812329.1 hypothetical protein [Rhodopseudomonas sp. BAL398]WOK18165.1 hypothetical protein RBJ75_01165 [Rhodopseudomonas sp. BAL398]